MTETPTRILEAAWALAERNGLSSVTLREVARASSVSRQAVYLHFGSRAGLLLAMARHHDRTSGFADRVAKARTHEPSAALDALVDAWCDYLPGILPVARALEASETTGDEGAAAFRDRMDEWHRVLGSAVIRVEQAGSLQPDWTAREATDWLWATLHPSAWQRLVVERGWSREQFVARTWRGIRADLLAT